MKRLNCLFVIFAVFFLVSCDTDNDDMQLVETEMIALNEILLDTEWRITSFTENGQDKTDDLENYTFVFQSSNELLADSNLGSFNGTWRVSNDAGSEFDPSNDLDFMIFFTPNGKLGELTNAYDVISANGSEINLKLEANADGNYGFLSFARN
ncbi:hypothetical protein [Christiangramia portivictoriae]|uniref:hypothetical protein n=1 Tax=Christiangramia portivictoriae TaxID=326069 RepID=UPI00041659BE|nr:hypothetical protein [Christiangramia portivictoriae]